MVMGQFVTTYRKDYLWPYVKTIGLKPEPDHLYKPQYRDPHACACHCLAQPPPTENQQVKLLGPAAYEEESWSRLGPMGPLLDPKLYPAKISAAPQSKISGYNQPNVFLKKLEEKYPFIYECLRIAPPGDILARINKDRLSSTYQVDYCKKMEYPSAPYDELIRAAGVEGLSPCPEPIRLPGDVCRPLQKQIISNRIGGGKACRGVPKVEEAKSCVGSCKGGVLNALTPGNTEYQDTVSRLGNLIIKERLHHRPKVSYVAASRRRPVRVKPKKKIYTCPKVPPGPYYRPYEIKNNFKIDEVYKTEGKRCRPSTLTAEISIWNPHMKENPVTNECLNKWAQMSYRDTTHVHGAFSAPKPKRY